MSWVISIVVVIAVLVVIIFLLGLAGKGPSSAKIANVCEKLLNANVDDRGFVIFEHKNRFIQYGIEVNGLVLNWPSPENCRDDWMERRKKRLLELGFCEAGAEMNGLDDRNKVVSLKDKELIVLDDQLFAQCGKDVEQIAGLTTTLLKEFCGADDTLRGVTVELELVGV